MTGGWVVGLALVSTTSSTSVLACSFFLLICVLFRLHGGILTFFLTLANLRNLFLGLFGLEKVDGMYLNRLLVLSRSSFLVCIAFS